MYIKRDAAHEGHKVASLDTEHPLQQWTQACEQFCELRNRVNTLIKQRLANPVDKAGKQAFVSQCSIAQLIVLEMDMTQELETLLADINRRNGGSFPTKLMKHVAILRNWNQRALSMLNLADHSTC
ncbi:hypothetical protein [Spirosoma sp. KUDC1026]|uniref:hypothetical protein n=1 Tax=Spirosoma sp. KUDC1026 TaxID=2745947 RepID=UPI00159BA3A1|nr:hypothetical protein [Spirosoma sp. KUDC1026]QKZ14307.1 hypothetical protein HU175_17405 [Spirosoma sp. KUDC1026]